MYSIAGELGRPTKDVQPFIDELQQRWYMRVSQLREIPGNVWREINVPAGLLQIIFKRLEQLQNKPISAAIVMPALPLSRNTSALPPVKKMETLEKKIINEVVGAHHPGVNPFEVIDPLTIKCHCCAKEINIKKGKLNISNTLLSICKGLFALTRHVQGSSCKGESRHAQNLCVWMAKSQRDGMMPVRLPAMQMNPKDIAKAEPECPSSDDSEKMEPLTSPPSSPERAIGDSPSKRKEPESMQEEEMERRCKCGVPAKVFKMKTENDQCT
jgi:hypothetical protein